jgi:hypothetical protein
MNEYVNKKEKYLYTSNTCIFKYEAVAIMKEAQTV